ncbi:uncharacterized protein MAM_05986 [Metarhizium album ARSEF 1941]|uniref:Uncharacterized protein n=1 Tax=Metarhizium album (strain ARSEF 1941) TaxID=1081103 RepID=A0A0B2WQ38_METAS|nr:uncharacterized protein MAM_05986 [Metarhizium album ARSEF 1941]KHN96138.1 hypothetical protein MAM_05986 [Metarhizium album ARSEF 1941]
MKSFVVLAALSVLAAANPLPRTVKDMTFYREAHCIVKSPQCVALHTGCEFRAHNGEYGSSAECIKNKDPKCIAKEGSRCGQTVKKCYGMHYGGADNSHSRPALDDAMWECISQKGRRNPVVKGPGEAPGDQVQPPVTATRTGRRRRPGKGRKCQCPTGSDSDSGSGADAW